MKRLFSFFSTLGRFIAISSAALGQQHAFAPSSNGSRRPSSLQPSQCLATSPLPLAMQLTLFTERTLESSTIPLCKCSIMCLFFHISRAFFATLKKGLRETIGSHRNQLYQWFLKVLYKSANHTWGPQPIMKKLGN